MQQNKDNAALMNENDEKILSEHEDFFEYSKQGIPYKVKEKNIVSWICDNYNFFILGEIPYFINETGCYVVDDAGAKTKRIIQGCIISTLCNVRVVNSIYQQVLFQDKRKQYKELNKYPARWIPFLNGFYDPVENRMIPIFQSNFVINQIPHEYNPEAKIECPTFDELLKYQLPNEDERELWLEYAGSCFNRDTSGQKWMIIKGSGGTGKSTQLNTLIDCLGENNVSNETLQGLTERFAATSLFGKLANICADISAEDLKRVDVLKKITGEDRNGVKHERKGKEAFFFTPFCKLLFSANEIPLNRDEKSDAFYRRLLITVMDRKPEHVDKDLQNKLHTELDGIIHRYMEALQRFYRKGGYTASERSIKEVYELRELADSALAFMKDELCKDSNGQIERGEIYERYKKYCDDNGRQYPLSKMKFFKRIRDEGINEMQRHDGSRCFLGVSFKDNDFVQVESDTDTPFT